MTEAGKQKNFRFKTANLLRRRHLALLHDVVLTAAALPVAMFLQTGAQLSGYSLELIALGTGILALASGLSCWLTKLHHGIWRYASLKDLLTVTKMATLTILIFLPVMFAINRMEDIPRSLPVLLWLVLIFMLGGPRFFYRLIKNGLLVTDWSAKESRNAALLIGDGNRAERFLRALQSDHHNAYRILGIVSQSSYRIGQRIHGVKIVGTLENLTDIITGFRKHLHQPSYLILADDTLTGQDLYALLPRLEALKLTLVRPSRSFELQGNDSTNNRLHPIEIEDLLGRPRVTFDPQPVRQLITGKRVLITGAGGSIGSELTRQIAGFFPASVILVELNEYNLYQIDQNLAAQHPDIPRQAILANIRDQKRLKSILRETRPHIVFHAAALKHVPLIEANPLEGILTNSIGTRQLADACIEANVTAVIQISTDKAVRPVNVMGATKYLAERYFQSLNGTSGTHSSTRFVTVRFGNVLTSSGSVTALFREQIRQGGPVTITHPDMSRYFMAPHEAVELVLQAGAIQDTTDHTIFVLDMGKPVRILDLAHQMIRLHHMSSGETIALETIGPRPGEKMHEHLSYENEKLEKSGLPGLLAARSQPTDPIILTRYLDDLEAAARDHDVTGARTLLRKAIPDYEPEAAVSTAPVPCATAS